MTTLEMIKDLKDITDAQTKLLDLIEIRLLAQHHAIEGLLSVCKVFQERLTKLEANS